jgi:hypothetical protein
MLMFAGTALTKNLAQKSRKRKSEGKHRRTRFPQSAISERFANAMGECKIRAVEGVRGNKRHNDGKRYETISRTGSF